MYYSRSGRRCALILGRCACVTLVRSRFTGFQGLIDAEALGEDGGSAVVEEMKASRSSPRSIYCLSICTGYCWGCLHGA